MYAIAVARLPLGNNSSPLVLLGATIPTSFECKCVLSGEDKNKQ
jgi:hypothetical protein